MWCGFNFKAANQTEWQGTKREHAEASGWATSSNRKIHYKKKRKSNITKILWKKKRKKKKCCCMNELFAVWPSGSNGCGSLRLRAAGWGVQGYIIYTYGLHALCTHTAVRAALLVRFFWYVSSAAFKLFLKTWIFPVSPIRNIISGKTDLRDFIKMKRYLHFRMSGVNKIAYFCLCWYILCQRCSLLFAHNVDEGISLLGSDNTLATKGAVVCIKDRNKFVYLI